MLQSTTELFVTHNQSTKIYSSTRTSSTSKNWQNSQKFNHNEKGAHAQTHTHTLSTLSDMVSLCNQYSTFHHQKKPFYSFYPNYWYVSFTTIVTAVWHLLFQVPSIYQSISFDHSSILILSSSSVTVHVSPPKMFLWQTSLQYHLYISWTLWISINFNTRQCHFPSHDFSPRQQNCCSKLWQMANNFQPKAKDQKLQI